MIRAYEKQDYDAVVALWQEAFGDTKEDIANCMQHFSPYLTLYVENNALLGMFMRLPVESDGKKGDYIYAVATAKHARGRGIATKLLETAKASVSNGERDFLVLVPAKPSLFEFYEKRGYTNGTHITKKTYAHVRDAKTDITIKSISPAQMYAYRKAYFKNLAAWDEKMLSAIGSVYGGSCYYALEGKNANAFCMAYTYENKLIVPELCLVNMEEKDAIAALDAHFGAKEIQFVLPDENGDAFAMFYPNAYKDHYFNLAIN